MGRTLQTLCLRQGAPVHECNKLLFVGRLRAFAGQGLEVECLVLKPAGDWVAGMKSPRQPLHVGLNADVLSCSSSGSGKAELG